MPQCLARIRGEPCFRFIGSAKVAYSVPISVFEGFSSFGREDFIVADEDFKRRALWSQKLGETQA